MPKLNFKKRIVPDEGKHLCTLMEVQEQENQFYDPKKDSPGNAKRYGWIFSYDQKPAMQIRTWSSPSLSTYKGKKSNALLIIEALTDKVLTDEEKEEFTDTDALIGLKCYLTVRHTKNDKGDVVAKVENFEPEKESVKG